jgi:enoyl-CoA hydratase/carnithine racemase
MVLVMSDVLISRREHVATITLNRPDRLNAISGPMLDQLSELFVACDADPAVRVVVLTGAGRGFCAGLDLQSAGSNDLSSSASTYRLEDSPPFVLRRIETPVLCALNGPAAGYGMDLALGCDLVIASESASFAPPIRRAAVAESGGTWLLPRLIGWQKACEVLLLGRKLAAAELSRLGLVNLVVSAAEFSGVVDQWAQEVAAQAPLAVRANKRLMRLGQDATFEANAHHVMAELITLFRTADFAEGIQAFLDKRSPTYQGR